MSFIRVCASFNRPPRHRPTANHRAEEQLRKQNTRNRNYLAWMVNRKDELSFEDRVRLPSCQISHLRSKFFLLFICCKHPIRLCFRNKASFRPVVYNSSIASQPVVTFFISKILPVSHFHVFEVNSSACCPERGPLCLTVLRWKQTFPT